MKIPCLLIAFSRVEGISRLLTSIDSSKVSKIYLAIDGPNSPATKISQTAIRQLVKEFASSKDLPIEIWSRDKNLGVAKAIISALDWFYSCEQFGVVLEDDLTVGDDFLDFIASNRPLLESDDRILLVSGNQFDVHPEVHSPRNWTNYPLIWGWATTSSKWQVIRHGILFTEISFWKSPFNRVENFWRVGALRVRSGQVDTWDIPFAYFMKKTDSLCLLPSRNLVTNNGNDQFAAHTSSGGFPLNIASEKLLEINIMTVPNRTDTRNYNRFLEKVVFGIRARHSFLLLVYYISSVLLKKQNWNQLNEDLESVKHPNRL
jgi:hypothetical protein